MLEWPALDKRGNLFGPFKLQSKKFYNIYHPTLPPFIKFEQLEKLILNWTKIV